MNSSGTIYSIYSPKKIIVKPTESIQIKTGITVSLPDKLHAKVTTQQAPNVPGTSPKDPLRVLTSDTYRRRCTLEVIVLILHIYSYILLVEQIFQNLKWDAHKASGGRSCGTSPGPNYGNDLNRKRHDGKYY